MYYNAPDWGPTKGGGGLGYGLRPSGLNYGSLCPKNVICLQARLLIESCNYIQVIFMLFGNFLVSVFLGIKHIQHPVTIISSFYLVPSYQFAVAIFTSTRVIFVIELGNF